MSPRKKPRGPFEALRPLKERLEAKAAGEPPARARRDTPAPRPAAPEAPEDESLLMARMFAGVTPLDRSRARVPKHEAAGERGEGGARAARRAAQDAQIEADTVAAHLRALVEGRTRFEVADDGARVEGRRVDLPLDALRRLRRGSVPVDARLDLHGMSVQQARVQLELFLKTTRGRGERCVLVIHGKGDHSPGGAGVLRGELSAWLSQGPASEHVAAFATARADDGGEGAAYVLLRR